MAFKRRQGNADMLAEKGIPQTTHGNIVVEYCTLPDWRVFPSKYFSKNCYHIQYPGIRGSFLKLWVGKILAVNNKMY